jgi:hypothetical protein
MAFVYPASDLDNHRAMIATLGSFWARTYTGIDQVHSYATATAELVAQSHLNVLELAASLSRFHIPVFHTENWLPIPLRRSQQNTRASTAFRFDRTASAFNSDATFDSTVNTDTFAYTVRKNLESVYQIFDKLMSPTITLSKNANFIVDKENGALVFADDPFSNPAFLRRGIYDAGRLVDEEIMLWGFKAKLDYNYIFEQFAYAIGLHLRSSENAKQFMNAIFSALLDGGTNVNTLTQAMAAICDIAVVKEPQETVELITLDAHGLLIATDKNAYRFADSATPIVEVGQTVRANDNLVRTFEIVEFNSGVVPDSVSALALDRGFVSACFYGDLIFENVEVPLEVIEDHPDGYTFVRFKVSGFPEDVNLFFDELHQRGVAAAELEPNVCNETPLQYQTKSAFPVVGNPASLYAAEDTGYFYRWRLLDNPKPEVGHYAEITEFERCHPPWDQFDNFTTFPTRGNPHKIYFDAAMGKFYRWVIDIPTQPPSGEYTYTQPPYLQKKLGTLAHLLDKRVQPEGEPKASDLPAKINPLQFLVKNVFRNNVFTVLIRVADLGQNRLGLYNIRHIRQVLPPNVAAFFVYELGAIRSAKNGEDDVRDTLTKFKGMEPVQDAVPEVYVKDRGVFIGKISGTCQ